jgi:hypothetical protein
MLRTNLATRPFYNDRIVRVGLALAAIGVAALTMFNVLQVLSLNSRNSEMTARSERAEAETQQFRESARTITAALDKVEVTAVRDAAHEANVLIEQRAFSWTDLFNRFENTLPPDVRIAIVEPQLDRDGRLLIAITTVSRRVEDLHTFIDQLETSGGLRDVIPRQQAIEEDGTLRAVLQGYYTAVAEPAGAAPPASEPSEAVPNGSAAAPNASPAEPRGGTR